MIDFARIIHDELFIACPFLRTGEFVEYCKKRKVPASEKGLELMEQEKLFFPIARVEYPRVKEKIRYIDEGRRMQSFGLIKEGEKWDGDLIETYGHFWFAKEIVLEFHREGLLWSPEERPFMQWEKFYDKDLMKTRVESFYSPFQIYQLYALIPQVEMRLSLLQWSTHNEKALKEEIAWINKISKTVKETYLQSRDTLERLRAIELCIAIANRYYFLTQADRRTITLSRQSPYYDWDWYEYRRKWNVQEEFKKIGISLEELKELQETVSYEARTIDPLANWYSLIQFVSLEEKKRLKDKALLAQTLYSMEMMLRLFYQDLTDEKISPPDDDYHHWKERFYGKGVPESEMEYLEFLTNQYHLNPRPKLILIVEGESEYQQIPRISEALGYPFSRVGILVEPLYGIDEFTGKKGEKGGKLVRFIDHYHHLQTIVYLILDNESRSKSIRDQLLKSKSRYTDFQRHVTLPENVFLWENNFEFDNFTDNELSAALNELIHSDGLLRVSDVKQCREDFGKPRKGDTLSKLFQEKTGRGLPKPQLAEILVSRIIANLENEFENQKPKRKILQKIMDVIHLASMNHQPVTKDTWLKNQEGGFFGTPLSQKASESKGLV